MPRVRIYDNDMVAPARTTDARFVAADNNGGVGGGLGAGLVGAGGALAHHADVMEDIRRARAAELEAVLQHQAIRAEVARRKGLSAEEATAAAHQAIGRTRSDVLTRAASPRIRDMLSEVLDQREATLRHELDAHVEREKSAAHIGSARRRQTLAQQDAVAAATPFAFHTHVKTMLDAADEHAALTGRDPGEAGADKFRALSAAHANRIGALLHDGDVDAAAAWHAAHAQALSGPDTAKVQAALAEPVARAASQARVDGLMGARTRDGDAPFSYADPLHGAGKTPVPHGDGGIHIPAHPGTPAYPSAAGIATLDGAGGITVTHADGSQTKYAGLGEARVKDGDKVTPDTILGTVAGAQGTAGLRYEVLQDGAPADPASAIERLAHEPGRHDVQALVGAIASHPDPEYAQEDRERDMAEVVRRADLAETLARPQQQQIADARTAATRVGEAQVNVDAAANGAPESTADQTGRADRGEAETDAAGTSLRDAVYRPGIDAPLFLRVAGPGGQTRNPRVRMGNNGGPPLEDWTTLIQIGVPRPDTPGGPLFGVLDSMFDLTGPATEGHIALLDIWTRHNIAEIRAIDPNHPWSTRLSAAYPESETLSAKQGAYDYFESELAATRYIARRDTGALQNETFRMYQRYVDQGYVQALRELSEGTLTIRKGWSREQALGSRMDEFARRYMRLWYTQHRINPGADINITVNNRLATEPEGSYRIPDVRVGGVIFDASLSPKQSNTPQVRGFYSSPVVKTVFIVRPTSMGGAYALPNSNGSVR